MGLSKSSSLKASASSNAAKAASDLVVSKDNAIGVGGVFLGVVGFLAIKLSTFPVPFASANLPLAPCFIVALILLLNPFPFITLLL